MLKKWQISLYVEDRVAATVIIQAPDTSCARVETERLYNLRMLGMSQRLSDGQFGTIVEAPC